MSLFKSKFDRKIYGWKRGDGLPNVGDELAKKIVKEILLFRDIRADDFVEKSNKKLLSIGSVLHFAKDGDVVWGSGINGKVNVRLHKFKHLDVRAVRGPRTKRFLEERNITVSDVFGDPALLAPIFLPIQAFTELLPVQDFIIIPHMSEVVEMQTKYGKKRICSPLQHPYNFIRQILSAKLIYSSSLHGIILAEAYGIPVVWLKKNNGENAFKYYDYYEGTGRFSNSEKFDFDGVECEKFETINDLNKIQRQLINSFPYDMWKEC